MTAVDELRGEHTVQRTIAIEGDPDAAWARTIFEAPFDLIITRATWIPDAAITGADTNNHAFGVVDEGTDGTGTGAVTTVKTYASGTDSVGQTPEDLTLGTLALRTIDAGDVISFVRTANGTGLDSAAGVIEIAFTRN